MTTNEPNPERSEHSPPGRPLADGGEESVDEWLDDDASSDDAVTEVGSSDTAPDADVSTDDAGAEPESAEPESTDETAAEPAEGTAPDVPGELLYETTPTIKPTLLVMVLTFAVGGGIEVYLLNNPEAVGGQEVMEILLYVVAFLLVVGLLRFLVRMLVLERTTYQITDEVIRREYTLLFRQLAREVPLEQLKAHELRRNRIQSLLGYGTVRFLTGGTNESLGFVEFENLLEPEAVRQVVRDLL